MQSPVVDSRQFGICPACNKPLSKDRSRQLTYLVNGFACFFVLLALGFIWYVRNPAFFQGLVSPVRGSTTVASPAGTLYSSAVPVTFNEFKALKVGMNLDQVRHVLGSPGTRTGAARVQGVPTGMYQWQNADGAGICVELRGAKLAFKGNLGLQPDAQGK